MTTRLPLFLSLFFSVIGFQTVCRAATVEDPTVLKPVGWEEMDEGRKALYESIWQEFLDAKADLKLSKSEEKALSAPEKAAFKQGLWEIRSELMGKLAEEGFEIESVYREEVAKSVKSAVAKAKAKPDFQKAAASVTGTITYDNGMADTTFGGGAIIGNRFDTFLGTNQVGSNGTVTQVQAVVVEGPANTTDSAGFVLEGPQTGGGGAMAIYSTFTNGLTAATETVTFAGFSENYPGSSFFVLFGDFASVYVPAFGTGTVDGQGHHGVVGYTGGMGPNITGTFDFGETRNALIRASGNILTPIPVELMKIEVESEKPKE